MSQNQTPETATETGNVITYESEDASGVAELRTPPASNAEAVFRAGQNGGTGIQNTILDIVREHNQYARGREGVTVIPEEIIDLPTLPTARRDNEGRPYIEDLNSVVRYYLDEGEVQMTEDFIEVAQTVDSNERTNTFATIYNVA